ncbi:hypothetical protein [Campylobacter concisus]|uniref:DUF2513 domain-containing protein n=1 Tax=Campylobacter concisus ATCC 51562 TaxID=1242969 RepID=U2GCR1_9BACT|nr:hypothetical protein [Campylobacter concisus]ERJ25864.1 hypothetical protein ATCC51562_1603 [Campylobacter concisus ATCC 51562]
MKNIELFDYYAGIIFSELIDEFPLPKDIKAADIVKNDIHIDEVNKHVAIVYYTCLWLKENGFVNLDNSFSSQKMVSNVTLTAKGLEILKQTPQSIDGKSLGDNLKAAVQTGKDEFIKQAVNKIFSLSLNLIS